MRTDAGQRVCVAARRGRYFLFLVLLAGLALAVASASSASSAATFVVTSAGDSGAGTLRDAITQANATPVADTIDFSIGSGAQTITLASELPLIEAPVTIDGATQPGYTTSPLITVDGVTNAFDCLGVDAAGHGSSILALLVQNCAAGVTFVGKKGHNVLHESVLLRNNEGVAVIGSSGNLISENLISHNYGYGIDVSGGKQSSGNYIGSNFVGTNAAGTAADGNGNGIIVDGTKTVIAGNTVSGNSSSGIGLTTGDAPGNVIVDNVVGTDVNGTFAIPNGSDGVFVGEPRSTIEMNLISGNTGEGLYVYSAHNTIWGNRIGTNGNGTAALPNGLRGVVLVTAFVSGFNQVGGVLQGQPNLISGNTGYGVYSDAPGNVVQGNYIGTNLAGTAAIGNGNSGVYANKPTVIGGAKPHAGNLISGNVGGGVYLAATSGGSVVQGNRIGLTADGSSALGNGNQGLNVHSSANLIGGTSVSARNVISANTFNGMYLAAGQNTVQGNFIGTDAAGLVALPNSSHGVHIEGTSPNNAIGGTKKGAGNLIMGNGANGINVVGATTGNALLGNSIFGNGMLGIDLNDDAAWTANDAGDADTGSNNIQNFPVIGSVTISGSKATITGTLNSNAGRKFRIEFFSNTSCDVSGHGEGRLFLGARTVKTNGSGNASFSVKLKNPGGATITATATDLTTNDTSEFSLCA